jgi:DNA-binding LacI/PurR family transcriptional regulator
MSTPADAAASGPRRRVTLADVAEAARVSRAQASDALNGRGRVSSATVARVKVVADRLGYTGNPHARSLRAGRTGIIGVHAAWAEHAPAPAAESMTLLFSIVRAASTRGYDTIVVTTPEDASRPLPFVDGMILIDPSPADAFTSRILASDIPTVTSEFTVDGSATLGTVFGEHRHALEGLLAHLSERGARSIGMFFPGVDNHWARELRDGYREWCVNRRMPVRAVNLATTWTEHDVVSGLASLRTTWPELDALVSGPLGAGAFAADLLASEGVAVGRDFLIAECDDGPELLLHDPQITALDWHPGEVGAACADLLVDLLQDPIRTDAQRAVPIDLQVRASTHGHS